MTPMLRGETAPVPLPELTAARESLPRAWGHDTLATPAGPVLLIRVPAREPDLLRDLEGAADALPHLELAGYRGCLLVGDHGHLGVSPDMLAALIQTRAQAEATWVAEHRIRMASWEHKIARLPSDAHRRLRAVIRVDAARVAALRETDFDQLAALLPAIKRASPGQIRPHWVHLIAHEDDVRLDGARFFTELEQRNARMQKRVAQHEQDERARKHEIARANLERVLNRAPRSAPEALRTRRAALPATRTSPAARAPLPPPRRVTERAPSTRAAAAPRAMPRAPDVPTPPAAPRDTRFAAAQAHADEVAHLKRALATAGYEIRERLTLQDIPIVLAAARPEGYPRRVVVSIWHRLDADTARRLLTIGKGVGAELVLAVAEETGEGVERVTVATNLKVITPDAVRGLRLD